MKPKKSISILVKIPMFILMLLIVSGIASAQTVGIFYDYSIPQHEFAAGDIKSALETDGLNVELKDLSTLDDIYAEKKVVIALESNSEVASLLADQGGSDASVVLLRNIS